MEYTFARTFGVDIQTGRVMWIGTIILIVLMVIAWARIFHKAGEGWWKILIPIYGSYCQYKIADSQGLFWGTVAVSACTSLITNLVARGIASRSYYGYVNTTPPIIVTIITVIAGVILLIMSCVFSVRLAHVFGKGNGFAVGLILLSPIFTLILAFGSAKYVYYSGTTAGQVSTATWTCPKCGTENPESRASCQNCGRENW